MIENKKQKARRDRALDHIAHLIEQWIGMGGFEFGGYKFKRGEVVERLRLLSFEKCIFESGIGYGNESTLITGNSKAPK